MHAKQGHRILYIGLYVFQCIMALAFALTSVKFIIYMWESDNKDLTANLVHGLSEVYVEP